MSTYQHVHGHSIDKVNIERYHEIGRDVLSIYRELQDAPRPLAAKELAAAIYLGNKQIEHRLDVLIVSGRVRRREDGPDGRVSYYEPMDRLHTCDGEKWLPRPIFKVNNGH